MNKINDTLRRALPRLLCPALLWAFSYTAQAAPGDLDPTFGSGGVVTTPFPNGQGGFFTAFTTGSALQKDGKIIVVGEVNFPGSGGDVYEPFVARYNTDGTLDATFGSGGIVYTQFLAPGQDPTKTPNGAFIAVAVQPDGKIIAAGFSATNYCCSFYYSDPVLARYNTDGTLDASFGSGGKVFTQTGIAPDVAGNGRINSLVIAPDGTFYGIGGVDFGHGQDASGNGILYRQAIVIRYSSNGAVMGSRFYNVGPNEDNGHANEHRKTGNAAALQTDSKLVFSIIGDGSFGDSRSVADFVLMRVNPDLTPDAAFGTGGTVRTNFGTSLAQLSGIVIDPNGKIAASGSDREGNNSSGNFYAARYNSDGSLDSTFGNGGKVLLLPTDAPVVSGNSTHKEGGAIVRQPDGRYLVGLSGFHTIGALRLLPNGVVDTTFGTGGIAAYGGGDPAHPAIQAEGGGILLQSDGKIVLPATLTNPFVSGFGIVVARLQNTFAARLSNISTRMEVLTGNNVLIGGFIVTGHDAKKVAIRGIGPSLSAFGVNGALADPMIELHDGTGGVIAANDNWKINDATGQSQEADVRAAQLAPGNDLESVVLTSLPANNSTYTVIVRGKNNTTGIGLVEVYDLGSTANSQLANISTRGFIDTGDNVMIGGFISGDDTGSDRMVVRAIGPSLASAGVSGALLDPVLELHDVSGTTVARNDDWQSDPNASQVQTAGLAPKDSRESALYIVVPPAAYTAIVRGKNNTTGIGLVEVYNLQ
ncbi:MAG: hypothetical protein ACR2MF_04680 [Chthoniobacterales bacterium]